MKLKNLWELISPITALIFALIAISTVTTTNYIFSQQQYIGLTLLFLSIFIYFFNKNIFRLIYLIFLVFGLLNIAGITVSMISIGILGIGIQPLFLLLFFLFIPTLEQLENLKKFEKFLPKENKRERPNKVDYFYNKFRILDSKTLENRLNEKLAEDARTAIEKILNERTRCYNKIEK